MTTNSIIPARFHFGQEEKDALSELFAIAMTTGDAPGYSGPYEEKFCREFAEVVGAKYADGVNSGTNAVYVALKALDLPPFSEVIVGCVTDPGGMMPVAVNNCIPVPADSMPGAFNTGVEQIAARITDRTRAIVVAHIGGEPANMPEIMELANRHHLPVIEDCAQAHGAKINGRNVGTFGRYGAFSLMFGKHICTGGQGGAVVCNDEADYWKLRRAADRGKPFGLENSAGNVVAAINCNMDELHAAIGLAQLKKLPAIVEKRRALFSKLQSEVFADLKSVSIPPFPPSNHNSYWWLRLKFNAEAMKCTKDEYCAALTAAGLRVNPNYTAAMSARMAWFKNRVNSHPWNNPLYRGNPAQEYPTPNADRAISEHFIFFIHENIGDKEIPLIREAFQKVEADYRK